MAEIFENSIEFMPNWANENIEDDLVKAVDEYEEQQKIQKTKSLQMWRTTEDTKNEKSVC